MVVNCGKLEPTLSEVTQRVVGRVARIGITQSILQALPLEIRTAHFQRVTSLLEKYAGLDFYAGRVIEESIRAGNFPEYLQRLEQHYQDRLQNFAPENLEPAFLRLGVGYLTQHFFTACYEELGIPTTKRVSVL